MAALKDQNVPRKAPGSGFGFPVLAGVKLFGRTLVAITAAGFAVKPDHADAVKVVGVSEDAVDNTGGANGDAHVEVEQGLWNFAVTGATVANVGDAIYAADDNTLQLTNAGGELPAGTLHMIDGDGHWANITT